MLTRIPCVFAIAILIATIGTDILAIPPECADPALAPAHLLSRPISIPQPAPIPMAVGRERVFFSDTWTNPPLIYSYPLNGGSLAKWTIQNDPSFKPWVTVHPLSGEVYVWGNSIGTKIRVYDPDAPDGTNTPSRVLFDSPGALRTANYIAFHPVTGAIYVHDQGLHDDGETWISRIQRFDVNGNFDGLVIDNKLGHNPMEDPNTTVPPQCGAWHHVSHIDVDRHGNVYLAENVDFAATSSYVHKFDSTGTACEHWDITGTGNFRVDADGYIYTGRNPVTKQNAARTETLWSLDTGVSSFARLQFYAGTDSDFLCGIRGDGSAVEFFEMCPFMREVSFVQFTAVTSQRTGGGTAFMYSHAARQLMEAQDKNEKSKAIREFVDKLRVRVPSVAEFGAAFLEIGYVSSATKQKSLVQYMLRRVDQHHRGSGWINYDSMTVEHIGPENPSGKASVTEKYVGMLGNLILVPSELNEELGNKPFKEKKKILVDAELPLDDEILNAAGWTDEIVARRTQSLALLCYKSVFKV